MCNEDTNSAEQFLQKFLNEMGFSDYPEMAHTAQRFTKLLRDFSNFDAPPISVFDVKTTGVVTLRNIPFYSLCAHHLMPFFGTAVIEYTPNHCVAGLSRITNTVQHLARKPTLQEALPVPKRQGAQSPGDAIQGGPGASSFDPEPQHGP